MKRSIIAGGFAARSYRRDVQQVAAAELGGVDRDDLGVASDRRAAGKRRRIRLASPDVRPLEATLLAEIAVRLDEAVNVIPRALLQISAARSRYCGIFVRRAGRPSEVDLSEPHILNSLSPPFT